MLEFCAAPLSTWLRNLSLKIRSCSGVRLILVGFGFWLLAVNVGTNAGVWGAVAAGLVLAAGGVKKNGAAVAELAAVGIVILCSFRKDLV